MCRFYKQLKKLPPHIQRHCLAKFRQLKAGVSIREVGAKYLKCYKGSGRSLSIPLSRGYRMVVKMNSDDLIPEWVGTHQGYDKWISK